jgi:choloylglycine hydrolase
LANQAYQKEVAAWQAGQLRENPPERFGVAAGRVMGFQPGDAPSAVSYAFDTLDRASGQATGGTPTHWSIVFDTENLHVHWRTSRNPQIRSVDFAKLDFACGAPVQMLDVHAPMSADVSDKLGRYTFKANLQHTLNFLEKWGGMEQSPLEVEVLERGLASFPCERPAAPYQEERKPIIPPVVAWAALALLHRLWTVGVAVGLAVAATIVLRVHARDRRR